MFCKIADFIIDFNNSGRNFEDALSEYICTEQPADYQITVNAAEAEQEKSVAEFKNLFLGEYAVTVAFRKLADWLPMHNSLLLHSATFDIGGVGIAFAAHSGTGKTTHMNLWQQLLGEKMVIVNGDKPIVRFFEDEPDTPYVYGNPWMGKEKLGCNMRSPLRHICFIERAAENSVEQIGKDEAINRIFNQIYMPKDPIAAMNTMQLIDRLMTSCSLWKINCNMQPEAAEVACRAILGDK